MSLPKALLVMTALMFPGLAMAQSDLPGSADHPALGRFDGAWIVAHDVKDYDAYALPTGPTVNREVPVKPLEGRVLRLAYKQPQGPSILEVMRNFTTRLTERGFEVLFECEARDCGRSDFRYGIEVLPIPKMDVNTSAFRYVAARLPGGGDTPETHASILVTEVNREIRTQVIVVESEAMQQRMIDARAMREGIEQEGRIALYGILFDTDSATIKPASRPALDEIAKLLTDQPGLSVLVVGHTDSQGSLDYNRDLSQRRAQAVVKALTGDYGIAGARLTPAGVGYLSPVATNRTEEGRALNRRVELVEP